jgi:hypothetical protein
MALPLSGVITLSDLQTEFGGTNPIGLNEYYRGGILVPNGPPQNAAIPTSGAISLSNFYGGQRAFTFTSTISSNTTDYNVSTAATAAGWDGVIPLIANITVGISVSVSATTTATPAFTVPSLPAGSSATIINNGNIYGFGGARGEYGAGNQNGKVGGVGLLVSYPTVVTNNLWIAGGGGGGGCGGDYIASDCYGTAGGIGGGGGSAIQILANLTLTNNGFVGGGGGGGGGGGSTAFGSPAGPVSASGGGGGGGQSFSGGTGGRGGCLRFYSLWPFTASDNGASGSSGSAGAGGFAGTVNGTPGGVGGNGGTYGVVGSDGGAGNQGIGAGGAAGRAVTTTSGTLTVSVVGTIYGAY